jgi:hypothetical protein
MSTAQISASFLSVVKFGRETTKTTVFPSGDTSGEETPTIFANWSSVNLFCALTGDRAAEASSATARTRRRDMGGSPIG